MKVMYASELIKLPSAKRTRNEKTGIHAWFPYYAGYSELFVEKALSLLSLEKNSTVLDPWNGSGTTTLVAQRNNFNSIGLEINPVMNIFAQAKNLSNINYLNEIRNFTDQLLNFTYEEYILTSNDPILNFYTKQSACFVRSFISLIRSFCSSHFQFSMKTVRKNIIYSNKQTHPAEAFLTIAALICAKQLSKHQVCSNPTWIKMPEQKISINKERFLQLYFQTIDNMCKDIEQYVSQVTLKTESLSLEASSTKMCIKDNSIDAIITSPPYLTRIDYAISTIPELFILSSNYDLRSLRERTIGSPIIYDKSIKIRNEWGAKCKLILSQIENHESKASKSYYLPNILQYFHNIFLSLEEINRVLKINGSAIIVVQSSFFKDIEIPLSEIYIEMALELGNQATIISRDIVRNHMAHINQKSNSYKSNKIFYEDIVLISK